ncbi:negative regulation of Rho guanyl-nucleotide exchange factor [Desmophyllum pertusum]|uniref:Negative regulation of Rho guanyl-nucleotide exchange factor n=1 Tax=Desmophyllum pertusum TaxID=174260 RepID=A0A9X0D3J4_9CNID|nr:negative regulation of Rho guanyl-nucleotide exchange factor [Desmophyllum pertusum]
MQGERDGQKWTDSEFTLRPSITDDFTIRVIEMRKIQANVQIGNILLRSRNYIKARPQGSMKLKMTVEWRPFSGKEENTLRCKRQSLLSEVIFIQAATTTSSDLSVASSTEENSSSEVVENSVVNADLPIHVDEQVVVEDVTDSSEVVEYAALAEEMNGVIPEESHEFRHATSLDSALQHLIPTLQTNKDQFPELEGVIILLEKLEELIKKCSLSRSSMSLSVESALESFDFLEQDATDEAEGTPRSTASGGSGCHDTGYNSTDDYNKDFAGEGSSDASYIVDFMISAKTVEYHADSSDADVGVNGTEQSVTQNEQLKDGENADTNSLDDSPSCISDIFSSPTAKPVEESASFDETEPACVNPSNTSSPRKRIDGGLDLLVESPQHSSHKTRSSRATSPNLSSSYGLDATVGNKVLDKVILSHLQFCEELSGYVQLLTGNKIRQLLALLCFFGDHENNVKDGHLGSFGPMKYKEMSALSKFRQQREALDMLIKLIISADPISDLTLPQINPRLSSSPALCSLWEKTCQGSLLFTTAGQLVSGFEDNYKKQITQSYNRVVDIVFPVIVARFEHYFMDCCRRNLSKYIDEVAYELVISKRLRSLEKDAVVAQLKQYTEIPLSKTCFFPVLCLLLDSDWIVAQAAIGLSIESLEESEEKLREGACTALTVLQARDSVPQLLYLSRCDLQSVKFAARKALSSLGEEGEDALRQSTMSSSEIAGLMF